MAELKQVALKVRATLESSGLGNGPISVHDKMTTLGLQTPSIAYLARIFLEKNMARSEPNKKPRAAYHRFAFPAPNACWQLDATEHGLTGGRKCVIFHLEDDHEPLGVASHVAATESSEGGHEEGQRRPRRPQRLLRDNSAALNPIRRGLIG